MQPGKQGMLACGRVNLRVCGGDAPVRCRGRRLRYLFHSDGAALDICVVQVPYCVILLLQGVTDQDQVQPALRPISLYTILQSVLRSMAAPTFSVA